MPFLEEKPGNEWEMLDRVPDMDVSCPCILIMVEKSISFKAHPAVHLKLFLKKWKTIKLLEFKIWVVFQLES